MKRIGLFSAFLILTLACSAPAFAYQAFRGPLGVLQNNPGAADGYVLICPQNGKVTYLMDKDGNVVKEWVSEYNGFYAELLPNGNMIRHSRLPGASPNFGGAAGLMEEFDWDGNVIWSHQIFERGVEVAHHTFEVMPNGNYMILVWEYKSYEDALAKGLDPNDSGRTLSAQGWPPANPVLPGIWPDYIVEINHDHEVAWEWHAWDHIGTGYNELNINKYLPADWENVYAGPDWTHFNGVAYNPNNNKVTVTSRNLGEVYVIDYASGDLIWRWGNPYNYDAGTRTAGYADNGDQTLFGPHAPDWTAEGYITVLDNGTARPLTAGSGFVELDWENNNVVFQWYADSVGGWRHNFYSPYQSGVNKMPNGSYLLTSSTGAHVLEIMPDSSIVWEFASPWSQDIMYQASSGHGQSGFDIHRAMFYTPDWPGFSGKNLNPLYRVPNWVDALRTDPVPRTVQIVR